jgi:hypothetical protein
VLTKAEGTWGASSCLEAVVVVVKDDDDDDVKERESESENGNGSGKSAVVVKTMTSGIDKTIEWEGVVNLNHCYPHHHRRLLSTFPWRPSHSLHCCCSGGGPTAQDRLRA